jgi:hypothetical protein
MREFTCFTSTKVQILTHLRPRKGAASSCRADAWRAARAKVPQFTCFTSTKVQILTQHAARLAKLWEEYDKSKAVAGELNKSQTSQTPHASQMGGAGAAAARAREGGQGGEERGVTRVVRKEGLGATESAVDAQHALAFSPTSHTSSASQKSKSAVSEQHALALIALSRTLGGGWVGGGHALVGGGRELERSSPESRVGQRGSGAAEIDRYKSTCWLVQKSACVLAQQYK